MFQQISPNEVSSAEGFRIKRANRNTLIYIEGNRRIVIEVEPGDGLAIYVSTIRDWILCDGKVLTVTEEERKEIIDRISRAYSFLGIKHLMH